MTVGSRRSVGMGMALSDLEPATLGFDALYRETASDLFAYACALVRDRAAAEDVTALAFERAFRRRDRFDPRRGTQRAWLFAIARNAALDELRRRRRTASLVADPAPVHAPPPRRRPAPPAPPPAPPAARPVGGAGGGGGAPPRRAAVRAGL